MARKKTEENIQLTAVEELWENQRFFPIRGWGTPFGLVPSFSERSGNTSLSTNDKFPEVSVKEGYLF
jgi:hypothetical protein